MGANFANEESETVKVAIRCRPMTETEMLNQDESVVDINGKEITLLKPEEDQKLFTFDNVFGEDSSQVEVYDQCARRIVQNVMVGYNGTILCYGQTGSGKTFTMTGEQNDKYSKGIMPRAFEDIFQSIET